jgi:hypothetical protein
MDCDETLQLSIGSKLPVASVLDALGGNAELT